MLATIDYIRASQFDDVSRPDYKIKRLDHEQ